MLFQHGLEHGRHDTAFGEHLVDPASGFLLARGVEVPLLDQPVELRLDATSLSSGSWM
jgi:hypothetical protein